MIGEKKHRNWRMVGKKVFTCKFDDLDSVSISFGNDEWWMIDCCFCGNIGCISKKELNERLGGLFSCPYEGCKKWFCIVNGG